MTVSLNVKQQLNQEPHQPDNYISEKLKVSKHYVVNVYDILF